MLLIFSLWIRRVNKPSFIKQIMFSTFQIASLLKLQAIWNDPKTWLRFKVDTKSAFLNKSYDLWDYRFLHWMTKSLIQRLLFTFVLTMVSYRLCCHSIFAALIQLSKNNGDRSSSHIYFYGMIYLWPITCNCQSHCLSLIRVELTNSLLPNDLCFEF